MTKEELQTVRVYRGDNGVQEFWESENGLVLIMRTKNGRKLGRTRVRFPWIAFRRRKVSDSPLLFEDLREETKPGRYTFIGRYHLEEVIEQLGKQHNINVIRSPKKVWVRNSRTKDGMPMMLKPRRSMLGGSRR